MNIFSIVVALLLEPHRPALLPIRLFRWFDRYAASVDGLLNSGERHHGIIAWGLAVLPVLLFFGVLHYLLSRLGLGLGWLLDVLVLTVILDFRPGLNRLSALQSDLRQESLAGVATQLGFPADAVPEPPVLVARGIELTVMDIHARLLAVLFWYCLFPGPVGALLYFMAWRLNRSWGTDLKSEFGYFARQAFSWLDWMPLRLTALAFAIVGNFEDSLFCWRTQASGSGSSLRIVLASAAGALGIRLGDASSPGGRYGGLELGVGESPDLDHLRSAEGMVWRTLVLWLVTIALLTIAAMVGG